jgi:hypothetical protein
MNKYALMQKKLVLHSAIAAGCGMVAFATMMLADMAAADAKKESDTLTASVMADENQLREIKNKIELSVGAEKRFSEIQLTRMEPSFLSKTELLVALLQESKNRYRLSGFKPLNIPPEMPSKVPALIDKEYNVVVRDGVTIEFEAISDVHVYSFLRHLLRHAPGFMRLQSIDIQRQEDLTPQSLAQLKAGQSLGLVVTKLQFTWIGIQPKPETNKPVAASTGGNP